MVCDTVLCCMWLPAFRSNILLPSSGHKLCLGLIGVTVQKNTIWRELLRLLKTVCANCLTTDTYLCSHMSAGFIPAVDAQRLDVYRWRACVCVWTRRLMCKAAASWAVQAFKKHHIHIMVNLCSTVFHGIQFSSDCTHSEPRNGWRELTWILMQNMRKRHNTWLYDGRNGRLCVVEDELSARLVWIYFLSGLSFLTIYVYFLFYIFIFLVFLHFISALKSHLPVLFIVLFFLHV
jgi:hypothetical protein